MEARRWGKRRRGGKACLEALKREDEVDELELVALVDQDEEQHEDPHL